MSDDQPDPEENRREQIRDILDDYSVDSFETGEPKRADDLGHVESREYKEYREAEHEQMRKNWYVRLVDRLGFFDMSIGDSQETLDNAVTLLGWDLDTHRVLPTALLLSALSLLAALTTFMIDIPTLFQVGALSAPLVVVGYFVWFPILQAQRKVVTSSDELILAILYMVIYMRNSPNLEGAVRFAALNTSGAVSQDFKRVLWETEVGNYTSVQASLEAYARRWRPYNPDFIESIDLLVEAMAEGDDKRREDILTEAIDNLLEGTRAKMKKYARELKMPVAATFGIGILLPVLGMILFPLVGSFMGGENLPVYLSFTYNFFLPITLYFIVYNTLIKRPPTLSTQNVESDLLPEQGVYTVTLAGRSIGIPAWLIALVVFLVVGAWPLMFYGQVLFGEAVLPPKSFDAGSVDVSAKAGVFAVNVIVNEEQGKVLFDIGWITMLRSLLLTLAVALSLGAYFYLGSIQRKEKLEEVDAIESEFPEALFQLGNALGRGNPIETGIRRALQNMRDLEIVGMFELIAYNMSEIGLTFEESIFDDEYGALRRYPSKLIESVMRAVTESAQKGTHVVSDAMMSISTYLKNIRRTEEAIEEQLSETLATMSFLAFILAPVISGVALGLGTIITKAFFLLQRQRDQIDTGQGLDSGAGGVSPGMEGGFSPDSLSMFGVENAVPPDILQIVIGVYLIELLVIIGLFYVRLTEGENPILRRIFTGKVLIVTPIIYAITTIVLVAMFSGMIELQMTVGG